MTAPSQTPQSNIIPGVGGLTVMSAIAADRGEGDTSMRFINMEDDGGDSVGVNDGCGDNVVGKGQGQQPEQGSKLGQEIGSTSLSGSGWGLGVGALDVTPPPAPRPRNSSNASSIEAIRENTATLPFSLSSSSSSSAPAPALASTMMSTVVLESLLTNHHDHNTTTTTTTNNNNNPSPPIASSKRTVTVAAFQANLGTTLLSQFGDFTEVDTALSQSSQSNFTALSQISQSNPTALNPPIEYNLPFTNESTSPAHFRTLPRSSEDNTVIDFLTPSPNTLYLSPRLKKMPAWLFPGVGVGSDCGVIATNNLSSTEESSNPSYPVNNINTPYRDLVNVSTAATVSGGMNDTGTLTYPPPPLMIHPLLNYPLF